VVLWYVLRLVTRRSQVRIYLKLLNSNRGQISHPQYVCEEGNGKWYQTARHSNGLLLRRHPSPAWRRGN